MKRRLSRTARDADVHTPLHSTTPQVQPLAPRLKQELRQIQAEAPQLSLAEQARVVVGAYVAAEEEEEEEELEDAPNPKPKPKPQPTRLPSAKGTITLVSAARPQPLPLPSAKRLKPAPTITTARGLKHQHQHPSPPFPSSSSTTAHPPSKSAAAPSPRPLDPALAKYEAEDEDAAGAGGVQGVSVERRRKVIRELVLAMTARDGGPSEEEEALKRARAQEGGWYREAATKQEYQGLCRATLESLYQ